MKTLCTLVLMYICLGSFAQPIQLKGTVKNGNRQPVEFANIVLQTAPERTFRTERNQCRKLPAVSFQHGLPHPGNLAERFKPVTQPG